MLLLACGASSAAAQDTGRIVGRIIDVTSGEGLNDVGVQVVGTTLGTMSGLNGRYTIVNVPAGTVTLQVRRIGYAPKTVTGLMLQAGQTLEQNITLTTAAVTLSAQVVTAEVERGSVNEALDRQRTATNIVTSITREQIARSPDSDAAQAVQRVSGVTVQDGRYVFVRGLGERYTTTSLNGARLPSPEPERKVVPLDLFPSSLLQSVETSKNFTPDQPGDFSGAQVNIQTREFPAERQTSYSFSMGYNAAATGAGIVAPPTEGLEWLGFGGSARQLPGSVAAAGDFSPNPSQGQINRMVNSFRNAWSAEQRNGAPNTSMGVSVGGNDAVLGRQIGYVGSLSYQYNQEVREDEVRAYVDPTGGTREIDRYTGSTGRGSVLWGGLLNLSTLLGTSSRLSLNSTYSRTSDNEARKERGFSENLGAPLEVQRLRFIARQIFSSQLAGDHQLNDRNRLDWSATASGVTRKEPDRSEIVYVMPPGGAPYWLDASEAAVRTFGSLAENSFNGAVNYNHRSGDGAHPFTVKFGGLGRYTKRDADNEAYSIQAPSLSQQERQRAPEEIFGGAFSGDNDAVFRVVPLAQGGSYGADDYLGAGYGMFDYPLAERLQLIGGARVEYSRTEVLTEPTVGRPIKTTPTYTDVLPSLALNFRATEQQNVRASVSQTLARPEYRELAPVQFRDVIGAENVLGNADLKRTLIQNADVKWEWYPDRGEVLSVGVFAKRFQDPIEQVYLGTSGTRILTYENAKEGSNYGVEFEARKGLGFLAEFLTPITVFGNATLMQSDVTLTGSSRLRGGDRPMVGQAPYVVNTGVTYLSAGGRTSATVLYNRVGRRIFSAAEAPLPDVYDEARDVLDLSLRFPVWHSLSGRFDAKNLFDADYRRTQGTVTRESYRAGRVFALGLSWQP